MDLTESGEDEATDLGKSFVDSTDSELTDSLNNRILEISDSNEGQPPQRLLTGRELRSLIFSKYKRTYDVAFARRDLLGKPIVRSGSLNSIDCGDRYL